MRDLQAGTTEQVNDPFEGDAFGASVSDDGRYVAYLTGDSLNRDVYVRDRLTGSNTLASPGVADGGPSGGWFTSAAISGDGRSVAFLAEGADLVPGAFRFTSRQVVVRDLEAGVTRLASASPAGLQADGHCYSPAISPDGRFVAFLSQGSNLVGGVLDVNETDNDVFVRDLEAGTIDLISVNPAGTQTGEGLSASINHPVAMSDDGRYVAWTNTSRDLTVSPDLNPSGYDVFVRDRQTRTTRLLSTPPARAAEGDGALGAAISASGNVVVFNTELALTPGEVPSVSDVFLSPAAPGPDLTASLPAEIPPGTVVVGTPWRTLPPVLVRNAGDATFVGPVRVRLFASADTELDAGDAPVASAAQTLTLAPSRAKPVRLKGATVPNVPTGSYYLLAAVERTDGVADADAGNNVVATPQTLRIAAPAVDLSTSLGPVLVTFSRRQPARVVISVLNDGNSSARGPIRVVLSAARGSTPSPDDAVFATVPAKLALKPGARKAVKLRFDIRDALGPGTYFLAARLEWGGAFDESNESNNTAISSNAFTLP